MFYYFLQSINHPGRRWLNGQTTTNAEMLQQVEIEFDLVFFYFPGAFTTYFLKQKDQWKV